MTDQTLDVSQLSFSYDFITRRQGELSPILCDDFWGNGSEFVLDNPPLYATELDIAELTSDPTPSLEYKDLQLWQQGAKNDEMSGGE